MNTNYNIGERIRELRTRKGLSQEQLALNAEITPTYLGLLERNLKNPTYKVIERICIALDVSLSDFFSNAPLMTEKMDSLSLQILSQIANCSVEEKKVILQIIKEVKKFQTIIKSDD